MSLMFMFIRCLFSLKKCIWIHLDGQVGNAIFHICFGYNSLLEIIVRCILKPLIVSIVIRAQLWFSQINKTKVPNFNVCCNQELLTLFCSYSSSVHNTHIELYYCFYYWIRIYLILIQGNFKCTKWPQC